MIWNTIGDQSVTRGDIYNRRHFRTRIEGQKHSLAAIAKMIESLTFLGSVLNCLNPYKENISDRVARPL